MDTTNPDVDDFVLTSDHDELQEAEFSLACLSRPSDLPLIPAQLDLRTRPVHAAGLSSVVPAQRPQQSASPAGQYPETPASSQSTELLAWSSSSSGGEDTTLITPDPLAQSRRPAQRSAMQNSAPPFSVASPQEAAKDADNTQAPAPTYVSPQTFTNAQVPSLFSFPKTAETMMSRPLALQTQSLRRPRSLSASGIQEDAQRPRARGASASPSRKRPRLSQRHSLSDLIPHPPTAQASANAPPERISPPAVPRDPKRAGSHDDMDLFNLSQAASASAHGQLTGRNISVSHKPRDDLSFDAPQTTTRKLSTQRIARNNLSTLLNVSMSHENGSPDPLDSQQRWDFCNAPRQLEDHPASPSLPIATATDGNHPNGEQPPALGPIVQTSLYHVPQVPQETRADDNHALASSQSAWSARTDNGHLPSPLLPRTSPVPSMPSPPPRPALSSPLHRVDIQDTSLPTHLMDKEFYPFGNKARSIVPESSHVSPNSGPQPQAQAGAGDPPSLGSAFPPGPRVSTQSPHPVSVQSPSSRQFPISPTQGTSSLSRPRPLQPSERAQLRLRPPPVELSNGTPETGLLAAEQIHPSMDTPDKGAVAQTGESPFDHRSGAHGNAQLELAQVIAQTEAADEGARPRRALRTRKANQLNPFTFEQLAYAKTLRARDWEDAVVTTREQRLEAKRRHALQMEELRRAQDNDEWLVPDQEPGEPQEERMPSRSASPGSRHHAATPSGTRKGRGGHNERTSRKKLRQYASRKEHGSALSAQPTNQDQQEQIRQNRAKVLSWFSDGREGAQSESGGSDIPEDTAEARDSSDQSEEEGQGQEQEQELRPSARRRHGPGALSRRGKDPDLRRDSDEHESPRQTREQMDQDLRHRYHLLLKVMPKVQAKQCIADLKRMLKGKPYHSDNEDSSDSSQHRLALHHRQRKVLANSESDHEGAHVPGIAHRRRIARRDSEDDPSRFDIVGDPESSSSEASPVPRSLTADALIVSSSNGDDDDDDDASTGDFDQNRTGALSHRRARSVRKEEDLIDRMLSHTRRAPEPRLRRPRGISATRRRPQHRRDPKAAGTSIQLPLPGRVSSQSSTHSFQRTPSYSNTQFAGASLWASVDDEDEELWGTAPDSSTNRRVLALQSKTGHGTTGTNTPKGHHQETGSSRSGRLQRHGDSGNPWDALLVQPQQRSGPSRAQLQRPPARPTRHKGIGTNPEPVSPRRIRLLDERLDQELFADKRAPLRNDAENESLRLGRHTDGSKGTNGDRPQPLPHLQPRQPSPSPTVERHQAVQRLRQARQGRVPLQTGLTAHFPQPPPSTRPVARPQKSDLLDWFQIQDSSALHNSSPQPVLDEVELEKANEWASLIHMRPNLGIPVLNSGVRLGDTSYITRGHLHRLMLLLSDLDVDLNPDLGPCSGQGQNQGQGHEWEQRIEMENGVVLSLSPSTRPGTVMHHMADLFDGIRADCRTLLFGGERTNLLLGSLQDRLTGLERYLVDRWEQSRKQGAGEEQSLLSLSETLTSKMEHMVHLVEELEANNNQGQQDPTPSAGVISEPCTPQRAVTVAALATSMAYLRFTLLSRHLHGNPWQELIQLPDINAVATRVIKRLLVYGLQHTMKAVRVACSATEEEGKAIQDTTVEIWVSLMSLLGPSFWPTTEEAVLEWLGQLPGHSVHPWLQGERTWFVLFSLLTQSQLSRTDGRAGPPGGEGTGNDQTLKEWWPLVGSAIASSCVRYSVAVEAHMLEYAVQQRDEYIDMVHRRTLLLLSRWGWKLCPRSSQEPASGEQLLRQLCKGVFDTKGHSFQSLPSQTGHDFPRFLRDLNQEDLSRSLDSEYDDDDRGDRSSREGRNTFHLYLRLLAVYGFEQRQAAAAEAGPQGSGPDPTRTTRRLFYRLLPVQQLRFSVAHPPTGSELSQLVNMYSLALVALYVAPSTDPKETLSQLRRVQGWLDLATADQNSQLICIRAVQYFGIVCQHHHLVMTDVSEWFAQVVDKLHQSLAQTSLPFPSSSSIESDRARRRRHRDLRLLLKASLRALRNVIQHPSLAPRRRPDELPFPSEMLLRPISDGLLSQLTWTEVDIGQEALSCIDAFFHRRRDMLQAIKETETKRRETEMAMAQPTEDTAADPSSVDSQDLWDQEMWDEMALLDDSKLSAMIGGPSTTPGGTAARQGTRPATEGAPGSGLGLGATPSPAPAPVHKATTIAATTAASAAAASARMTMSQFVQHDANLARARLGLLSKSLWTVLAMAISPKPRAGAGAGSGSGSGTGAGAGMIRTLGASDASAVQLRDMPLDALCRVSEVNEMRRLLETGVDCLAESAAIRVSHGLVTWPDAVLRGDKSLAALPNPGSRLARDVVLRFEWDVLRLAPHTAGGPLGPELVKTWFRTVAARHISVQALFTQVLAEVEPALPFFQGIRHVLAAGHAPAQAPAPAPTPSHTEGQETSTNTGAGADSNSFLVARGSILLTVVRNMRVEGMRRAQEKGLMLACLPHLLATMCDEVECILMAATSGGTASISAADQAYVMFVRQTVAAFPEAIGGTIYHADFFRYIPEQLAVLRAKLQQAEGLAGLSACLTG